MLVKGYTPIIASDGDALLLLQKEFPTLKLVELPSYKIQYPKNGKLLKLKLFFNLPVVVKTINKEKKIIADLIVSEKLIGIISDNRMGVRNAKIPSVYITHQLNVLSGITTFLTSSIHQYYINKFDECWIPDDKFINYSGILSKSTKIKNQKFIGVLSRFTKKTLPIKYDLLVLLSGLEPLRSQLEKKLISELKRYKGKVLFVRGIVSEKQKIGTKDNITFCNYLLAGELEKAINESELVLARSGYSTIMDLATLGKQSFFIPTTGQNEQEYLARHLDKMRIAPYASENKFKIEMLVQIENYRGFSDNYSMQLESDLFDLFQCK